ncbi:MAG: TolC family protein [Cyanobium sp. LacPavin_0920_WC12_MAG_62_9]|nr:TolC family protein [Cyanobium sp. LacPavin_0920_WC12_MAG_62_9]
MRAISRLLIAIGLAPIGLAPIGLAPIWLGPLAGAPSLAQALAPMIGPNPQGKATDPGTAMLQRSWNQLDAQLKALDALIPPDREAAPKVENATLRLPASLLQPNAAPRGELSSSQANPAPPLSLPTPIQLKGGGLVQGLSLEQSLALAFANSASLQAQREEVAASLALLQAQLGTYWPRISAFANGSYGQEGSTTTANQANNNLGLGPLFNPAPNGIVSSLPSPNRDIAGPFYVPAGGSAADVTSTSSFSAGLSLDYALVDFARTPKIKSARAQLANARNTYANEVRKLQLQVSEAYYQLQQADQLVRIQDANVRKDLVILQDTLDLKQAGLVPRLDVLRRRSIEASNQENLIQALADRAVARRRLAVVLNLPPDINPSASDPIALQSRWPLNLEQSLLAAYQDNPELQAILATRDALAQQKQATAAGLLPKLSLFASGGSSTSNATIANIKASGGGCCGSSLLPDSTTSGWDWSIGLTINWLLFDAGTTSGEARALAKREAATLQQYAAQRNDIRLRMEQAFFNHEASLAKLASARRAVSASLEAFRDVKLRYLSGLSNELLLSNTQDQLINSLIKRLTATVNVNITYAQLLRELLPVSQDPNRAITPTLQLGSKSTAY